MKVLITGGAGFVGTSLTEYLSKKGFDITILDNFSRETARRNKDHIQENFPDVKIINGDVRNYKIVKNAAAKTDIIIHAAAQVAVTNSVQKPREDLEINILGTFNVLEAARKQKQKPGLIYFSTNKVYGDNVNKIPLLEEETRYDFANGFRGKGIPEAFSIDAEEHTPYGCSKLAAELYVRDYNKIFDVPSVANRCSCMFGTNQYGTEDQGWLAHFIISSILEKPLTIYGDGKQVRDVLYAKDLAELIYMQTEKIDEIKGEVFNVGGGPKNTLSIKELLKEIEKHQALPEISYCRWRPADQKVYYSDISKLKEFINWKPKTNPENGVKELYKWAKGVL